MDQLTIAEPLPLMCARDVALLFNIQEETVRQWARDGLLPSIKISRKVRFHRDVILTIHKKGLPALCTKTYTSKKKPPKTTHTREIMPWEKPLRRIPA